MKLKQAFDILVDFPWFSIMQHIPDLRVLSLMLVISLDLEAPDIFLADIVHIELVGVGHEYYSVINLIQLCIVLVHVV